MKESGIRSWDIWTEGYKTTGESAQACRLGSGMGRTFEEAVSNFFSKLTTADENFDPTSLTYWGCRLFPTEAEARRSFG